MDIEAAEKRLTELEAEQKRAASLDEVGRIGMELWQLRQQVHLAQQK